MQFNVVIGNPPYQEETGGDSITGSAVPIYQHFIDRAKSLGPNYVTMVIPAKWYTGGRNLDEFRGQMLTDNKLTHIVDYYDSKDCFDGVVVSGGICYFLLDKKTNNKNVVTVTNHYNGNINKAKRELNSDGIFIRDNLALNIIEKALKSDNYMMDKIVGATTLFGLKTNEELESSGEVAVRFNGGIKYTSLGKVTGGHEIIDKYKVIVTAASHDRGARPDKDGKRRVISRIEILEPGTICTATYIVVDSFSDKKQAENMVQYLKGKFARFLMMQMCNTQHISIKVFKFVPYIDTNIVWTDRELYTKYGLTVDEVSLIERTIKDMPSS